MAHEFSFGSATWASEIKSKHHNRQRLVLGPNTLLNVYINNTLDYYITKILDEYTKPTVQQSRINYKHE